MRVYLELLRCEHLLARRSLVNAHALFHVGKVRVGRVLDAVLHHGQARHGRVNALVVTRF